MNHINRTSIKKHYLLLGYMALSPLLIFPLKIFLGILYNWIFGSAILITTAIHGQKQELLNELTNDWLDSLPISFFISWLVFVAAYLITTKTSIATNNLRFFSALFSILFVFCLFIFHFSVSSSLSFSLAVLSLAIAFIKIQKFGAE